MIRIDQLSREEYQYICERIPVDLAKLHFKKHTKVYQKINPGFRIETLSRKSLLDLLEKHKKKPLISDLVAITVTMWIDQIEKERSIYKKFSEREQYQKVLAESVFDEWPALYFKLSENKEPEGFEPLKPMKENLSKRMKEHKPYSLEDLMERFQEKADEKEKEMQEAQQTIAALIEDQKRRLEEYETLFSAFKQEVQRASNGHGKHLSSEANKEALKENKGLRREKKQLEKQIEELTRARDIAANEKRALEKELEKAKNDVNDKLLEQKKMQVALNEASARFETLLKQHKDAEVAWHKEKEELEFHVLELEEEIKNAQDQLTHKASEQAQIFATYNEERSRLKAIIEKQRQEIDTQKEEQKASSSMLDMKRHKPLKPKDMETFRDRFESNVKALGLTPKLAGYDVFVAYMMGVLFRGKPLLMKQQAGMNIANAVANALSVDVQMVYFDGKKYEGIGAFKKELDQIDARVICIHNVAGSFYEYDIFSLLSQYRHKIIILTYTADRTLYYISGETLSLVHYVNVDHYQMLYTVRDLKKRFKPLEEVPYDLIEDAPAGKSRLEKRYLKITKQCGIKGVNVRSIVDEVDLDGVLLFSLLPYVAKVLEKDPYNESKDLQRYGGDDGRSPHKDLIVEWFDVAQSI